MQAKTELSSSSWQGLTFLISRFMSRQMCSRPRGPALMKCFGVMLKDHIRLVSFQGEFCLLYKRIFQESVALRLLFSEYYCSLRVCSDKSRKNEYQSGLDLWADWDCRKAIRDLITKIRLTSNGERFDGCGRLLEGLDWLEESWRVWKEPIKVSITFVLVTLLLLSHCLLVVLAGCCAGLSGFLERSWVRRMGPLHFSEELICCKKVILFCFHFWMFSSVFLVEKSKIYMFICWIEFVEESKMETEEEDEESAHVLKSLSRLSPIKSLYFRVFASDQRILTRSLCWWGLYSPEIIYFMVLLV